MRPIILLLSICLTLTLAGCGAVPWNPQNNAGLTNVHMVGCGQDEGIDGQMFCDIHVVDGKEKANVSVIVSKNDDGTFTASYQATDVSAFGGQALRAEVEGLVSEALRQAAPELAKMLIDSARAAP